MFILYLCTQLGNEILVTFYTPRNSNASVLHVPSTVGQQPTCHFRNIEIESTDDRHLESFDALGPGRWILKKMSFPSLTAKRWQTIVPYFSQILTIFSLNLCNNSDQTWFSNTLTFARSLGRCWKPRPTASVFNISLGTWQTLMHGRPCLIPILKHQSWSPRLTSFAGILSPLADFPFSSNATAMKDRLSIFLADCSPELHYHHISHWCIVPSNIRSICWESLVLLSDVSQTYPG